MAREIAEAELQSWFEENSRHQMIGNYIVNDDVLATTPKWQRKGMRESERARMEALDKARKVYTALGDAQYLSGNRSISDEGHTQLRPDLIMISPDAHYILVELKTRKVAERQGIQELLAYSAAMKIQLPFINEFMFVIVARYWDTLLSFSVRSLIMDGKHVLPLLLEFSRNGEIQLRIQQALFDLDTSEPYDPFYAMVPHTLATMVYQTPPADLSEVWSSTKTRRDVEVYFRRLAFQISAECQTVRQSGFVMVWKYMAGQSSECFNLTVVTVNQFWKYSEHLSNEIVLDRDIPATGINRVKQNAAKEARDEIYSRSLGIENSFNELEDIFLSAEAWQAEASLYAQSSLSFDLLVRHSDPEEEERIRKSGAIQQFEYGGVNNLASLMQEIEKVRFVQINLLATFGDIADFLRERNIQSRWIYLNLADFQGMMKDFRTKKLSET